MEIITPPAHMENTTPAAMLRWRKIRGGDGRVVRVQCLDRDPKLRRRRRK